MATRRFIVKGVVQGVGFRWFVSRQAESLGVSGRVWNRNDGSVEVIASHTHSERIAALEKALWAGPGSVLSIEAHDVESGKPLDGFRIESSPAERDGIG